MCLYVFFLYKRFRYLIESGTELDTGPDPALHLALRKQHIAIAQLLLQAGSDFEIKDSVSLIYYRLMQH